MNSKQLNKMKYGGMPQYESINMEATGRRIKMLIKASGYKISEIQEYLNLSCPQPIYRWCKGKVLPSLDHLYALSVLFNIGISDIIVADNSVNKVNPKYKFFLRMYDYLRLLYQK